MSMSFGFNEHERWIYRAMWRFTMMLKTAGSVTVLTLALGIVGATAQTGPKQGTPPSTVAPKAPVAGQILTQDANTILADDFIGLAIYTPDKTKIGKISDLILSQDAKTVEGFVVGVNGFLGLGEKSVALKLDR